MTAPTIVILAAGRGSRMRSALPKVLHPLCGRPLVHWPVQAARDAGAGRIVVVDSIARPLDGHLPQDVVLAVQERPNGTADALESAAGAFPEDGAVVVLSGDVPLVTSAFVSELMAAHAASGAAATMATMLLDDPGDYGRVLRDAAGDVTGVVEAKAGGDATADQRAIREVNTGIFAFDARALRAALPHVGSENAQAERYLPDVLPVLRAMGLAIAAHVVADATLTLGVNDRADLAAVRGIAQARIHDRLMRDGVTIVDPGSTTIDADVAVGRDTVIEPHCTLTGATLIGAHCRIGAKSTLTDALLGDGVTVRQSWLDSCDLHDGATVGPFAYLRPGAVLRRGAKAGTFVEIKNAQLAAGAKVPHLSYIGDASIGERTNIGAGAITANYDGRTKHRTTIGRDVHTSSDNVFVAPVTIGDGAWTAAGSVITDDVPPDALAVARAHQKNIEGYGRRKRG
jgi:bifunctional UDP-N-acetylglucosamine pyrophosphorylase/glucosamine-1-phosphate N-acetyltransferase